MENNYFSMSIHSYQIIESKDKIINSQVLLDIHDYKFNISNLTQGFLKIQYDENSQNYIGVQAIKKQFYENPRLRLKRVLDNRDNWGDRDRGGDRDRDRWRGRDDDCKNGQIQQGRCVCKDGYYKERDRDECRDCNIDNCKQCDRRECNLCMPGYYLQGSQQGFSRSSNSICKSCPDQCTTCEGQNKCTSCTPPLTIDINGNCINCNTQQGQFIYNGLCKQCKNCKQCQGEADDQCLKDSCQNQRLFIPQPSSPNLGSCVSCDLNSGKFVKDGQCLNCYISCKTCNDGSATGCKICKNPQEYLNDMQLCGSCQINEGYYIEINSEQSRCKKCDPNCKQCENNSTTCTKCSDLMGLDNGKCIKCEQKDGLFIDEYGKCTKCDISCKTCSKAGSQNCIQCADGYSIDQKLCKKCDTNLGFFIAPDNTCQRCHDSCASCKSEGNSKTSCLTCKNGLKWLYINNQSPDDLQMTCGNCKTNEGFYVDSNGLCKSCPQNCSQCSIKGTDIKCDKCAKDFYFDGDQNNCIKCQTSSNFYVESGLKCKQCDITCSTCISGGSDGCSSCSGGYLMHSETKKCVTCNQPGEIKSDDNKNCLKCKGNCQACNQAILSQCTSCLNGYSIMPDKTCQKCEGNSFIDAQNNCLPCNHACNGCNSKLEIECKDCAPGYSKKSNGSLFECIKCPDQKFFVDSTSKVCSPCNDSCLECNGPNNTNCTKCQSGEDPLINGGLCTKSCKSNEYYINSACKPCHDSCQTCNNASNSAEEPNMCIECSGNKKKLLQNGSNNIYTCVNCDIGNGFYTDNMFCHKCIAIDCSQCSGDKGIICTKCKLGKYLKNDKCVDDCNEDGYYKSPSDNICLKCPSNCKTCVGQSPLQCSNCMDSFYFNSQRECITCPDELFFKKDKECISCHQNCLKCNGTEEKNCSVCKNNQYIIDGTCQSCPTVKYFENKQDHKCLECDKSCETCEDEKSESFKDCTDGLHIHEEGAKKYCKKCDEKNGYFIDSNNFCKPCTKPCANCSGINTNQCLSCQNNMALMKDSTCQVCNIDDGYFKDKETQQCDKCHPSCKTCSGLSENNCMTCPSSKYLNNKNMCVDCSEQSNFKDQASMKCIKCHESCKTCNGPDQNNCLTCITQYSYFETNKTCKECPSEGFYSKDQKCQQCHQTCSTCTGPQNSDCNRCKQGLHWNSQDLCEQCPVEGYFIDKEDTCIQCIQNCKKCSSQNSCDICNSGFLVDQVSKQCIKCDQKMGFYPDQSNGICKQCDQSCQSCNGPTSQNCLVCKEDYFKIGDSKECNYCQKSKSYLNQAQNCQRCEKECQACQENDEYIPVDKSMVSLPLKSEKGLCQQCKCAQCKPGFILVNGQCISKCSQYGENFEDDPQNRSCKCKQGYEYQMFNIIANPKRQFCSKTTMDGYFCMPNNKCYSCSENCQQCQSASLCRVCSLNYYLWEGKCIPTCFPDRNIIANNEQKICQCESGFMYIQGNSDGDQSICLIPLKLEKIEINNTYMNQNDKKTSSQTLNNLITFVLNRSPRQNEIKDFEIFINENKLVKDSNYFVRNIQFLNNIISVEVEVPENRRVTELTYTLNGQKNILTLKNVLLTSQDYNKQQISQGGQAAESMQGLSEFMTPKEGDTKVLLDNLKRFQILCFLSNFVQVLAPITLFKESIPPQVYIGGQLGASFIFSNIKAVNEVSFDQNSTSIKNNSTQNNQKLLIRQLQISTSSDYYDFLNLKKLRQMTEKMPTPDRENKQIERNFQKIDDNSSIQKQDENQNSSSDPDKVKEKNDKNQDQSKQDPNKNDFGGNQNDNEKRSQDKERERDRDWDKDKDNDKDRDRDRDRDRNWDRDRNHTRPHRNETTADSESKNTNEQNQVDQDQIDMDEEQLRSENQILQGLGLEYYLYSNFIFAHLIIVICSILILLCLIARKIMPGKQYTLKIVNRIVNRLASFTQGSITAGLFSIYFSLQFEQGRGLAIFQIIVHIIFICELIFLLNQRSNNYIQKKIPNFFDGINPKAKGAKSYILISFLKKYLVILIFLIFSEYPSQCCIAIAVIFLINGIYIAKYRFFEYRIMNYVKILQEWIISVLFILLVVCIKKYEVIINSDIIPNEILEETKEFSFLIIIFIITCLSISLAICIFRTIVLISTLVKGLYLYIQQKHNKSLISSSEDLVDLSMTSSYMDTSFTKKILLSKSTKARTFALTTLKSTYKKAPSSNLTQNDD